MEVRSQNSPGTTKNFETLRDAFAANRIVVLRVFDKVTGQDVSMLCAVNPPDEDYEFIPLAVMVEENSSERYAPPK